MQNVQLESTLGENGRVNGSYENSTGDTTTKVQTGDASPGYAVGKTRTPFQRGFRILLLVAFASFLAAGIKGLTRRWWDKPQTVVVASSVSHEKKDSSILPAFASPSSVKGKDEEPLYLRGYTVRGTSLNVVLSDGSVYTEADREMTEVQRNYVVISGVKYRLRLLQRPKDVDEKKLANQSTGFVPGMDPAGRPGSQVFGSWQYDQDGVYRLIDRAGLPH